MRLRTSIASLLVAAAVPSGCDSEPGPHTAPACAEGETQPCYSGPAGTAGIGICHAGARACLPDRTGFGAFCDGEVTPAAELCATAMDDDCDGAVNEGGEDCACAPGETRACYTGPADTLDVGACVAGTAVCNDEGLGFGPCEGETLPEAESCATQIDDDCSGAANEGCACEPGAESPCYSGPAGTAGVGSCKGGTATCLASGDAFGSCAGEVLPAALDDCATPVDENCDGVINELGSGCVCTPGAVEPCYGGPPGTEGTGICAAGTRTCLPSGLGFEPCAGETLPAPLDDCATPEDENCDGAINEAGSGCVCAPGTMEACYGGPPGTEGVGACMGGSATCLPSGDGFGPCIGEVTPVVEDCATLADEDCDGAVNQGCACPAEDPTSLVNENCANDYGETAWKVAVPNIGTKLAVDGTGGAVLLMRRLSAVAGYEPVNPISFPEILVARYDASGAFVWGREAFASQVPTASGEAYQLDAGDNGHVALSVPVNGGDWTAWGGSPIHTANNQASHVIYSVAPDGTLLYTVDPPKLFQFENANTHHGVACGTDGSVFYANGEYSNPHVIKYGPSGAVAWDHAFTGNPIGPRVVALPDGGVLFASADAAAVSDMGLGPLPATAPQSRDLLMGRFDAAGNVLWAVRPQAAFGVVSASVDGAVAGITTDLAFLRVSLVDGTILSSDAAPSGLTYTPMRTATVGASAAYVVFLNTPATDFGFGQQPPYNGMSGIFFTLREPGAMRWARAPGGITTFARIAGRAGGLLYTTIGASDQLDLDGAPEATPPSSFLVRMAY